MNRALKAKSAASDRQDSELFRRLVESVSDYAIFMLDASGHVATWNVGAERIKGYHASEIIGKSFALFYPEADVRAGKCELELKVAAKVGRFEDEGWRVRKDGSRFWANVVISAVRDDDGKLLGFSKVTRDLTERKRAEEAHAARLAAEQANRVKDEFLAMLGHELRNPLAPIVTALQLMKLRSSDVPSPEQQVIERQVKHMMRLVEDLLDISRITRGTIELKKRHLDIREVLAKALELASPLLEQRGHYLETQTPGHPVVVDGDEARLTQVFSNLLVNAAQYTEPGGHIRLLVQQVDGQAIISVRDDGAGIDPQLLPHVFDLFIQGQRGADRSMGGLGIGLTLVRVLMTMHGGIIRAQSPGLGQGSTFTAELPLVDTKATSLQVSSRLAAAKTSTARRILVVDDNADAKELLSDLLSTIGHEVATAGDAAQALQIARSFKPQVGVLDIGLPVMDGYELALKLKQELGIAAPLLIAVTGYGQSRDRERSAAVGFIAHLVKPVDMGQLIELIDSLPA